MLLPIPHQTLVGLSVQLVHGDWDVPMASLDIYGLGEI
jgi:hypothetical protein